MIRIGLRNGWYGFKPLAYFLLYVHYSHAKEADIHRIRKSTCGKPIDNILTILKLKEFVHEFFKNMCMEFVELKCGISCEKTNATVHVQYFFRAIFVLQVPVQK